jgi:hypothetical protein
MLKKNTSTPGRTEPVPTTLDCFISLKTTPVEGLKEYTSNLHPNLAKFSKVLGLLLIEPKKI